MQFTFDNKSDEADVSEYTFTKFDPVTNKCLAKHHQFPLKLAYLMTIHKSQGMGLPAVDIDCKNATNPGQIGVAVGRALSFDGLRVVNYKASLCRQHQVEVSSFYDTISKLSSIFDD